MIHIYPVVYELRQICPQKFGFYTTLRGWLSIIHTQKPKTVKKLWKWLNNLSEFNH